MKWKVESETLKHSRKCKWHKWFAWYPVKQRLENGYYQYFWLQTVWRRLKMKYEYKDKDFTPPDYEY